MLARKDQMHSSNKLSGTLTMKSDTLPQELMNIFERPLWRAVPTLKLAWQLCLPTTLLEVLCFFQPGLTSMFKV